MGKSPLTVASIPVHEIEVGERIRDVSEQKIEALIEVFAMFGCLVPILVRKKGSRYILLDGAHRLEAAKRSGIDAIPCSVQETTELDARMVEASMNLAGGMTALDDAVFLAAWEKAYHEKYPETVRGTAGALARHGGAANKSSFAQIVAEQRGITPRQVQKVIAVAKQLTRDEQRALRVAPQKVSLKDLQDIGKITDPTERAYVLRMLGAGEAKKASQARVLYAAVSGEAPAPKDPVEEGFKALLNLWARVPAAARRRFVDHVSDDLRALLDGGAE